MPSTTTTKPAAPSTRPSGLAAAGALLDGVALIERIPGIKLVAVSMAEQIATVVYNDMVTDMPEIATAPHNAGYPAWPIDR
jgi:copper chaperone CopZ